MEEQEVPRQTDNWHGRHSRIESRFECSSSTKALCAGLDLEQIMTIFTICIRQLTEYISICIYIHVRVCDWVITSNFHSFPLPDWLTDLSKHQMVLRPSSCSPTSALCPPSSVFSFWFLPPRVAALHNLHCFRFPHNYYLYKMYKLIKRKDHCSCLFSLSVANAFAFQLVVP